MNDHLAYDRSPLSTYDEEQDTENSNPWLEDDTTDVFTRDQKRSVLHNSDEILAKARSAAEKMIKDPVYLPTFEEAKTLLYGYDDSCGNGFRCGVDGDNQSNVIFELFTAEYISALGDYLKQRVDELNRNGQPVTILEVGAGRGKLTYSLREYLTDLFEPDTMPRLVATDDFSWGQEVSFPVEDLDYRDAIQKYSPQIIIQSWMPCEEDFTGTFRRCDSVEEFILIGEGPEGCCGDSCPILWREMDDEGEAPPNPNYTFRDSDGFIGADLEQLSKYQVCRTDYVVDPEKLAGHSCTYSFKRQLDKN